MSLQQLFTSRKGFNASTYVAHNGKLFYDEANGYLRLGDGVTPGGKVVGCIIAIGSTPPAAPHEGELWYNPTTKELWAYHAGAFVGTINAATTSTLGGIKAGPGVVIASDGTLSLDSSNIPFSFGDFYAFTNPGSHDGACLSSVHADQNINIVSNGEGNVNIVGSLNVHKVGTSLEDSLTTEPILRVKSDGQIRMLVPLSDSLAGALEIIGNDSGISLSPNQTGVILHVTGNTDLVARNYFDAINNYALLAGRRTNGTQLAPAKVLNNEVILRIVAQAAGQATTEPATFQTYGTSRITFYANEDQKPTAQGGRIGFEVTKNGTVADATGTNTITVASMDAQNGLTATKFVGPLTGNVTGKADTAGNADTVTNGVYTSGSYSDPSWLTISATKVGLGNVTNESKATMFTSPTFTGNVAGVTKAMVGLGSVDNTSDATKNVLYATTAGGAPATDVYAWAKAATKPSYTKSEVGLGSVENTALSTSTFYLGTTQVTYNRASGAQTLAGVSVSGNAGTVTNGVYTTDTGTVTSTMLAGSIDNAKLTNSALTVGTTAISLGSSSTALAGMTNITFVAGSTTVAPIKLTAGSVLSSPAAGAVEYDGTVFYTTPNTTTRGMLESKQIYTNVSQVAMANNGTQQSIFGLTNGVAVSYATRYKFKIGFTARVTADNVNLFFALGGTATYYRGNYHATVGKGAYGPGMMPTTVIEVAGLSDGQVKNTINISQGGVGGSYFQTYIEGFVDTQYSGYIKPIVLFSPIPGAGSFIDVNSFMEIYPVGPAASGNANTIIGNWS